MSTAVTPDARAQQLSLWVAQQLDDQGIIHLHPIASDAGFRRYFRFASPSHWLAVDAPPSSEDSGQFIALAHYLSEHGVHTPKIRAADASLGFLLVEDFGDALLHSQLNPHSANSLYRQAFASLLALAACPDQPALIPRYDRALLRRELGIFSEWFATALLGYELTPADSALLDELFSALEASALEQPQCLVHRDFHSRNLLLRPDQALGVIDFQGALWGGCCYDLVSLLRDCYIRWPAAQVKAWALEYHQDAIAAGVLDARISASTFLRWFDWLGLQRHIKVLGIFARLHLRDGKTHYLQDLPLVIRYTLEVAQAYPELQAFAEWFCTTLLPRAEQQTWYRDYRHAGEPQ